MKSSTLQVLQSLGQDVNHFDNADAPNAPQPTNGNKPALSHQRGNPMLGAKGAQFALLNITLAFSVSAGAFTQINFSALPTGAQGAMFFFSFTDFANGYQKAKALVQLATGFTYGTPFVYGSTPYPVVNVNGTLTVIDNTVNTLLRAGDVVVPISVRSGGVDYVTLSVHRCQQIQYSSMLCSNVSNSFDQKGIRMILQDTLTATLIQFTQALYNYDLSWLGKYGQDSTDINSNNQPDNFKANVIDIPLTMGIMKSSGLASPVNLAGVAGNTLTITLSMFVSNAVNPQTV